MRGTLIMFDGPDGVGKTTQIELATAWLQEKDYRVYVCRINGGTPFGEKLRDVMLSDTPRQPMTEHYTFMAMHTELRYELDAHLRAGEIVLMDRSPLSDWAYQKFGGHIDSAEFERNIDLSMKLFSPDLVICYSASLPLLRKRMSQQLSKKDYFDSKPDEYFKRVIDGYQFAAEHYGATVIDARPPVNQVHDKTMRAIQSVIQAAK